jgi:Uma2 family endonuclease
MAAPARVSPDPHSVDHFVYLHGVSWDDYERILALRGESSVPRMAYLKGELELMSPSWNHEDDKKRIARLLEAWSEGAGVPLAGAGHWTLKKKAKERGLEPDECYVRGEPRSEPERPDLCIEVVWTSGGIDKLLIYEGLQIPEVWFWMDEQLSIFVLRGRRYVQAARSQVLPELDPELLPRYMRNGLSQGAAAKALREEVSGG